MSQNNKKQKKGYYKKDVQLPPEQEIKEILSSDEENPPDFSYLLNIHSSSTQHLITSDLKKLQNSESIINTSKYFNVDINLLNSSIKSIPFYKLQSIYGIEWSEDEIRHMNEEAKLNEETYKQFLNSHLNDKKKEFIVKTEKISKDLEQLKVSSKKEVVDHSSNNKESMEKWLDNVLDL